MNSKIFYLFIGFTLFIVACKQELKTPSGFKFEVTKEGTGDEAKIGDVVFITAKILTDKDSLVNEFTEGEEMPTIKVTEKYSEYPNINPFEDIFVAKKPKVGSAYRIFMPLDSIPGGAETFKNSKMLYYDIQVSKIMSEEEFHAEFERRQKEENEKIAANKARVPAIKELVQTTLKDYGAGKLDVKTTFSGLKYYIIKEGEGEKAVPGDLVTANYYGTLVDGNSFDNSFDRGREFQFKLGSGQVIKGWDEGFTLLNKGSKAFLFVPAELGYGEAGSPPMIPGNSELVFYVELEDIQK
ncbi:MAG: FKBP-type peptidyl-prolyl cis-trans isomerase [Saprospiraceae bacterium]|nr:MAG: FKBP-type peptidylprolyl isomerase [Bacteroidetes bacterium OLB9]MCO6463471.1 FKBP-type peptidyl-prolyl cis-trans isomerase [Saprospiraceae bacterium]MCZ2338921.1 FKBP-type peptidyl-prolyl cis-trans isomerase [Chitinophagales bacterium]